MQVVLVPRFPVCKRTLPPRRHTGAGGLARYAPLPPLCTRCCDGLLLLATKGTPSLLRNLEHKVGRHPLRALGREAFGSQLVYELLARGERWFEGADETDGVLTRSGVLVVAAARSSRRLSRGAAILCVSCGVILIENGVRVHAAPLPCHPAATWVSEPAKGREHRD